jgi:hypothetical protein
VILFRNMASVSLNATSSSSGTCSTKSSAMVGGPSITSRSGGCQSSSHLRGTARHAKIAPGRPQSRFGVPWVRPRVVRARRRL